jgi:hypothetical protein
LETHGYNELQERPRPGFWQMFLAQFNNFVIWILIGASAISALLGDYIEASAIMAIVILNAAIGVVQEGKAEEALAALKKMTAPDAQTIRDGHRVTIAARELVPGDVVLLEAGNFIPADLRLLEGINLKIDEASLTGESRRATIFPPTCVCWRVSTSRSMRPLSRVSRSQLKRMPDPPHPLTLYSETAGIWPTWARWQLMAAAGAWWSPPG